MTADEAKEFIENDPELRRIRDEHRRQVREERRRRQEEVFNLVSEDPDRQYGIQLMRETLAAHTTPAPTVDATEAWMREHAIEITQETCPNLEAMMRIARIEYLRMKATRERFAELGIR